MNSLPKELVNIIIDYKSQLEVSEKFKKCMKELKNKVKYYMNAYDLTEEGDPDYCYEEECIHSYNTYFNTRYTYDKEEYELCTSRDDDGVDKYYMKENYKTDIVFHYLNRLSIEIRNNKLQISLPETNGCITIYKNYSTTNKEELLAILMYFKVPNKYRNIIMRCDL